MKEIFDVSEFDNEDRLLLYQFAVLPSLPISYRDDENGKNLVNFLGLRNEIDPDNDDLLTKLPTTLDKIVKSGWVKRINYSFQMHPLLQEVILIRKDLRNINIQQMLVSISRLLEVPTGTNPVKKLEFLKYSQSILERHKQNIEDRAIISNKHSAILIYLGEWQEALYYQKLSYKLKRKIDKSTPIPSQISLAYANLALIYTQLDKLDLALKYAQKDLRIKENYNVSKSLLAKSYNGVALLFENKVNYPKSLYYHQKSIALRESIPDKSDSDWLDLSTAYNNISIVYRKMKSPVYLAKGFEYQQKAIAIREERLVDKGHYMFAQSYGNYADLLFEAGRLDEAVLYHFKAIKSHKAQSGVFVTNGRKITLKTFTLLSYRQLFAICFLSALSLPFPSTCISF